ncbi:hypothetical protein EDB80DRAFT_706283 [Ilyonectria destructans]|nr:hypothetical protein EDB80DRAFT_706283 [Ilyonectria destructans]
MLEGCVCGWSVGKVRMEGEITSTPAGDSGLYIPTPRGGGARLMMSVFFPSLSLGIFQASHDHAHTLTRAHPPPKAEPGHRRGHGGELRRRPLGSSAARQLRERRGSVLEQQQGTWRKRACGQQFFFLSPRSLSPFPASRQATRPLPLGLPRVGFVPRDRGRRLQALAQGTRASGRAVASFAVGLLLGGCGPEALQRAPQAHGRPSRAKPRLLSRRRPLLD